MVFCCRSDEVNTLRRRTGSSPGTWYGVDGPQRPDRRALQSGSPAGHVQAVHLTGSKRVSPNPAGQQAGPTDGGRPA